MRDEKLDCICDAQYSGVDEELYRSLGCPKCECTKCDDCGEFWPEFVYEAEEINETLCAGCYFKKYPEMKKK